MHDHAATIDPAAISAIQGRSRRKATAATSTIASPMRADADDAEKPVRLISAEVGDDLAAEKGPLVELWPQRVRTTRR